MGSSQSQGGAETVSKGKTKARRPKLFKVILLNDDYTSMDFAVSVLETIFKKSPSEAVQIMLAVHNQGRGICGVFTKDIAETKILLVHERARGSGFPLQCTMEEA